MMAQVLYFAYGSNISIARMVSRIASAQIVGQAYLTDYKVLFNKRSKDGSGKANLKESAKEITWGVLYEIHDSALSELDNIEGGYNRKNITVQQVNGGLRDCITYISSDITDDPRAYEGYKKVIVIGARENDLPKEYIYYLEQLPSK